MITARQTDPQRAYVSHLKNATKRGISFTLTFDQWWNLWEPHWNERAARHLVMCRHLDSGGYDPGNVRIDTTGGNNAEARRVRSLVKPERPPAVQAPPAGSLSRQLYDIERSAILAELERCRYNEAATARALGVTYRSLRYSVRKFGLM